jgi:hypothetical protein
MTCCAVGACDRSQAMGGPGCDLCDRVAMIQQPVLERAGRPGRARKKTKTIKDDDGLEQYSMLSQEPEK